MRQQGLIEDLHRLTAWQGFDGAARDALNFHAAEDLRPQSDFIQRGLFLRVRPREKFSS
jgi:hypothetical protein